MSAPPAERTVPPGLMAGGRGSGGRGAGVAGAAVLMTASLALVLTAGALARELGARYGAAEVLFLRFVLSLAVVAPAAFALAGRRALSVTRPGGHTLRALSGVGAALIFYAATQHLPFADLVALSYAAPMFVVLLSGAAIGERVGTASALCVALGMAGVFQIAPPTRLEPWSLAALAMAFLNAVCILATRRTAQADGPAATGLVFVLAGCLLTAPAALLTGFRLPDAADLPAFLLLGFAAGAAILLNAAAFRRAPAAVLAPIDYLGIAASAVIGFLWWGEEPSSAVLLGGIMIAAAGLGTVWFGARKG